MTRDFTVHGHATIQQASNRRMRLRFMTDSWPTPAMQ